MPVGQDQFAVGSNVDKKNRLVHTVNARRHHPGRGVATDEPADLREDEGLGGRLGLKRRPALRHGTDAPHVLTHDEHRTLSVPDGVLSFVELCGSWQGKGGRCCGKCESH